MSPRKRASQFPLVPRPLANAARLAVGPARTPVLALLIILLFASAWYWGWQQVRGDVLASPEYMLTPDDIVVTNRPEWMRFDIREKVFRDASLHQNLSIMDPELNGRIAAAFANNPWVAKVHRVSKGLAGGIVVDLEYHVPVLMVYSRGQHIPVDVEGNALPRWDIPINEVHRYPRLDCDELSTPRGVVGDPWGDPRVAGAAEIAAALGNRWRKFHLDRIEPVSTSEGRRIPDVTYRLRTRSGSSVLWGHAPGLRVPGEPTADEKIAFLDAEVQRYGTLEGTNGWKREIDLLGEIRKGRLSAVPEK